MKSIAIVDLDGTIFSHDLIDIGLLYHIKEKYGEMVIVSNNSSISHLVVESLLSSFTHDVLTPQLIARSLVQSSEVLTRSCCLPGVNRYLTGSSYSLYPANNSLWNHYFPFVSSLTTTKLHSAKIGLVGKNLPGIVSNFIDKCLLDSYSLVALNVDRISDSKGLSETHPLLGDLFDFNSVLCKTSEFYVPMIHHLLIHRGFSPSVVFGDNSTSDGYLSSLLQSEFVLTIFGQSECSRVVNISDYSC